ncbi:hypothetical protein RD792_009283 [Penstemon davidsonii]|uniref:histidine kinase n=1 Tax=Penstemon davidsonii TaxID=160366 RepID=A0ABR0CYL8_9LAMI|nr:hypothetical protein RD792_009283 [Penstemon davidsonii]
MADSFSAPPPSYTLPFSDKTRRRYEEEEGFKENKLTDVDSIGSESELESDGEKESFNVVDNVNKEEVDRVCRVIDETFAFDRNMEAVLDECGVNLSHDLVLAVLERFKHARKPAFRFFYWASDRPNFAHDSSTYNAIMSILGKTRQFETMVSVLEEMGEKGLLTIETFTTCIKAFASAKERKKAVGIFDLMKKYKYKVDLETINCLLDALGREKLGKEAQNLFEKLEHKFTPDLRTYTILLNGWCKIKNLMEAGKTWNTMIDNGFKPDIVAHNIMLEGLLKSQKRSDAIKLFEVMKSKGPFPNTRSYTILIRNLCKHGKMSEAFEYFNYMLKSECAPDAAMYTCLMIGFANQKKMEVVYNLMKDMKEKGCPPDGRTYNAMIKMMTNRHMPDDAVKVYKKMVQSKIQPTIHTFNMIMKSYFIAKNYEMGCEVWEEMKRKGCCPDENAYTVLIGGLIRQGRSIEACKYLEEMMDKGMRAPQLDYKKFSGKVEVANALARNKLALVVCENRVSNEAKLMHSVAPCLFSHFPGILNSILDTTKIEAGKMQLIEEEFDLEQLLEDVVDLYHPVGMKKGIDVILDPYDGSITKSSRVKGDSGKLKQILCNLLSNAVKFTSEGHVIVRAWSRKPTLENELIVSNGNKSMSCLLCLLSKIDESENNSIQRDLNCTEFVFEVNDTGKGIPKEKQKSVFENYVQVKETTGIGQEGTGLGLGIVQSLVRLMGGEIIIMDKEVGERGTCFIFNVFFTLSEPNMSTNPNPEANIGDYISCHSPTKGQRSHMILFIQSPKRSSILQNFIEKLGIKVHIVKQHEQLIPILKKIKQKLINLSSHSSSFPGKSDIICSSSSTRSKEVPLSALDGMDNSFLLSQREPNGPGGFVLIVIDTRAGPFEMIRKAVAEFRRELNNWCRSRVVWLDYLGTCFQGLIDPLDLLVSKPFHGSRLYQAIGLLPEYRNMTPPIRVENNVSPVEASISNNVVKGNFYGKKEEKRLMTGKKILVADDDPIGRKIAVFVANQLGASVFTCENGEEAWKLVCRSLLDGANAVVPFDCILMDCQMPVMDGIEATRRIREAERNYGVHIPIIALTAYGRGEKMENMIRAGVDACLTKPLNKEFLFKVISELKP